LTRWMADYYACSWGQALDAVVPAGVKKHAGTRIGTFLMVPQEIRADLQAEILKRRLPPKQVGVLEVLCRSDEPLTVADVCRLAKCTTAPIQGLQKQGLVHSVRRRMPVGLPVRNASAEQPTGPVPASTPVQRAEPAKAPARPTPTGEQTAVLEQLVPAILSGGFAPFLIHGVTGSGKTEVYLRVVERALRLGRSALVLVPEIGLTPQLVDRFRRRFAAPMAVLHSALTDHERLLAWREAFSGRARIVLGTRSAVFAPVPDLGVIIVDEEHDMSFKQHEGGFRYSARDLAVVRAQRGGVPVVLGSATPALETLHNVTTGRYTRLVLTRRAAEAAPPRLSLIDLRSSAVRAGISTPAVQAIARHLASGGQVLVFLNRRGYAPTLLCTACGWLAPCRDCDARLTVHLAAGRLRCHHCGADTALPERCPQCGFAVKAVGQGTERIEETLATLFPGTPCIRLDRDVVRRRGDMEEAMRRMASGEARILVGTQMVTKGHDFPNVTLVVVLNADQGFFSTDFRAPERLAQTIVQVAGRAGRGEKAGEVLIQTEFPDHPLLRSLLAEGYDGFARVALAERSQASWPPFSRLAAVRDSAKTAEAALAFLTEARKSAEDLRGARDGSACGGRREARAIRFLGPAPAAMAKRAGRYHAQLLVESADRAALHHFLAAWLPALESLPSVRRVRWALDVDPIEIF
jgi:primosomal protein N' (replication factor Y) (superfamily II helicase)